MVQVIRRHPGTIHCHPIENKLQPKMNRYSVFLMEGPAHERVSPTSIWICVKIKGKPPKSQWIIIIWLVVWNIFYFSMQLGRIIPTDELIFFRGVAQPLTSHVPYEHMPILGCSSTISIHRRVPFGNDHSIAMGSDF